MMANMVGIANDIREAKRIVGGAMGEVERYVANAKRMLGTLGVSIRFGATIAGLDCSVGSAAKQA
jgi:hypothetical protein